MCFFGVTLALVSPVDPELTNRLVQTLFTTITSGAGASDWIIKFGTLVTFCVFIDSLDNAICHKLVLQLSPLVFSLSLDDALFLTGLLILKMFKLVESNG